MCPILWKMFSSTPLRMHQRKRTIEKEMQPFIFVRINQKLKI